MSGTDVACCYQTPMQCVVLTCRMMLPDPYAMCGTDIAYGARPRRWRAAWYTASPERSAPVYGGSAAIYGGNDATYGTNTFIYGGSAAVSGQVAAISGTWLPALVTVTVLACGGASRFVTGFMHCVIYDWFHALRDL
eukprot:3647651-Rhodomonas_salina.2